jgi:phosphatidylserine/phosphatidylglycerophosphate/cardiolipin synthase-like enzyme
VVWEAVGLGSGTFTTLFLRDVRHGGPPDQLTTVAEALAGFVAAARTSLDIAIYDFRLDDAAAADTVVGALVDAAAHGVAVRIGYDAGKPPAQTTEAFAALGADPAPVGTQQWVTERFAGTAVQLKAIRSAPQLMHSKFVVRDAGAGPGAVWTGSTNFTDAAWTRQENNVLVIAAGEVAQGYAADFGQLWDTGAIKGTGAHLAGTASYDGVDVGWDFSPGDGPALDAGLVGRIRSATSRLVVGSMVLTSHRVLAALAAALARGVPLSGVYDGGQMEEIAAGWKRSGNTAVLADWHAVASSLARKSSAPYTPDGPHDFMHLKVLLADDIVTTGSYNFSANAERNAENQVHLDDAATVAAYAEYLAAVTRTYA